MSTARAESPRAEAGCQPERRTFVHASGAVLPDAGTFTPCLVNTGMTSGESGLAISRDGTLLRSVATKPTGIAESSDDGQTWERRLLPSDAKTLIADSYIDPVTDRYFYVAAGATPVFFSDDLGRQWQKGTFDAKDRQDWPRLFSGRPAIARANAYPTNVYYCNWTSLAGIGSATRCYKSVDGGQTFVGTSSQVYKVQSCADKNYVAGSQHGRGIVDPRDGTIFLPLHDCGKFSVAISRDEGATWRQVVIPGAVTTGKEALSDAFKSKPWTAQLLKGRLNIIAPEMAAAQNSDAIAMDASGRLYAVWVEGRTYLPRMAMSSDGGQTWSTPVAITPPDVVQAVLPSISISPDGKVGIAYYGTTDKQNWTGYLTVTRNAAVAISPSFETATVTRPGEPLMAEPCCSANGLQEYTAARCSKDGSLWAAFVGSARSGNPPGVLGRLLPAR